MLIEADGVNTFNTDPRTGFFSVENRLTDNIKSVTFDFPVVLQ